MPMYFQPGTFQDNNPALAGMQSMVDIIGKQIQNQFAPQMNMQDLQRQQLANQLSQINLQTAPQMNQADLAIKLAQPGLIGAQANQANAQAGYLGEETKYVPLDTLIKAQQTAQMGSRFGQAYQLSKSLQSMSPAARDSWIAQNQDSYNDMLTTLGNQSSGAMNFITPGVMNRFFPGMISGQQAAPMQAQQNPQMQIQNPQAQNNNQSMRPIDTGAMSLSTALMNGNYPPQAQQGNQVSSPNVAPFVSAPHFAPSTPDQVAQIKLANQLAANNSLTTAATRKQYEGAIQVEGMMNSTDFQNEAINAAKYAGALGKGKSFADALSQQNPQAYEDYLSFKDQRMVLLANRIKQLDAMGSTDTQRDELHGLYKKTADALTSNPDQFVTQLNNLGKAISDVAESVQKSATPMGGVNRLTGYNQIQNPYSQNNFQQSGNAVTVIDPTGQTHQIDRSRLSDAFKKYPDLKVVG